MSAGMNMEVSLYYNGWNDGYKKGEKNMQDFVESRCRELGIDYTLIFTCNNADI